MKNIILVGFMGVGKTAVSKALAKKMKKPYVSTDKLIEEREGKSISDIFDEKGEKYFRKIEKVVVKEVCKKADQVIDAGGGAILDRGNLEAFRKNGIVVCLWASPEIILDRTKKYVSRPLLDVADPKKRIQELLEYRRGFYKKAHFHIDTTAADIAVVVDRIAELVKQEWEILLARLLRDADSVIMVTDSRGKWVFANARCLDYFGLTEEHLRGKNWIDTIVPKSAQPAAREKFKKMQKSKTTCRFEMIILSKEKKQEYFNWVSSPLKEKTGSFTMLIGRPTMHPAREEMDVHPASNREILEVIFSGSIRNERGTARHSLRVMSFAVSLAEKIKMAPENIETLKIAALLHDVGKMIVDKRILFKKGKLKKYEFEEIKKHPGWSVEMIRPISFLSSILPIVINHHENFDGSGYPKGVKGERIPLGARILSIADVYEALTADRPYRKAFTKEEAIKIMEDEKGWKLDPKLTDIFLDMARKDELKEEYVE